MKTMTILATLATACFIGLVVLQVLEFMHYGAPPSLWPPTPN